MSKLENVKAMFDTSVDNIDKQFDDIEAIQTETFEQKSNEVVVSITNAVKNNTGKVLEKEFIPQEKPSILEEDELEEENEDEDMLSDLGLELSPDNLQHDEIEIDEDVDKKNNEDEDEDEDEDDIEIPVGKNSWSIESPSPKFNDFYRYKIKVIKRCCVRGQIPFEKWLNELKDSSVDMSVVTFDTRKIYTKMQKIQMFLERLKEMQIESEPQYFLWKRAIVLMRGKLARIESDKPAIKQEGIYSDYMYDVEMYFADLEGFHEIAEKISKTLDGAFNCLSRQVTIAMPLRTPDRRWRDEEAPDDIIEKDISVELEQLDDLHENDIKSDNNSSKLQEPVTNKGPRKISWSDVRKISGQ